MKLKSRHLGEIDIDDNQIIIFPEGIPGFEDEKQFVILPLEQESPFYYLHAVTNPDLCLLLSIPFVFFPDYQMELPGSVLENLKVEEDTEELVVFVVLTVPEDFKKTTANLLAPVIINPAQKCGLQFVPGTSSYTTRHPIFPDKPSPQKQAAAGQGL
ncbi:MAG: flagellar assembly protein FliW [Syntrophomonadaceae bacterium]|nr:flagellar assembly protein FliW [Syntrophomonadaceae bacterium]